MNLKVQDNDHSSNSSIIAVNVDGYLKLFNVENNSNGSDVPVDNDQLPILSSTPIVPHLNQSSNSSRSEDSQRNSMSKYLSSPEHFPSFNVNILNSDSGSSQDECDLKVKGHQESKTRSGRIYKTI